MTMIIKIWQLSIIKTNYDYWDVARTIDKRKLSVVGGRSFYAEERENLNFTEHSQQVSDGEGQENNEINVNSLFITLYNNKPIG